MISTIIALPYELARIPLIMIDQRLSERLPETSGPRVTLHRAIGSTDKLVGSLLGNRGIRQRGVDSLERFDKVQTAARLEEDAASRRELARDAAAKAKTKAARMRREAQTKAASGLEEADVAEARGEQAAKTKAAKTAAAKKAAANKRAASRKTAVEQSKARVDAAAEAKQKTTQSKAKVELDEARTTKKNAADARADAERLKELAEAKKQARKQG